MRETIAQATTKNILRFIVESDSQFVIISINGKICIPKEIITLVEGIKMLSSTFSGIRIEYSNRLANMDADMVAENANY